jgi:hypothetical protein
LADFLAEDEMFEFVELVSTTAVFRRTDAKAFDPTGDGWWLQDFNRRRIQKDNTYLEPYILPDNNMRVPFAEAFGETVGSLPDGKRAPAKNSNTIKREFVRIIKKILGRS